MEGVGALILVIAGWLAYCSINSFRPIAMGRAIVTNPKDAATIIQSAKADVIATKASAASTGTSAGGTGAGSDLPVISDKVSSNVKDEQSFANKLGKQLWGSSWNATEMNDLVMLWNRESGWNPTAENSSSGAYGIPQALPASKLASAGSDWKTNPATQIEWGLEYIKSRYGSPSAAWAHEQSAGWY